MVASKAEVRVAVTIRWVMMLVSRDAVVVSDN